MHACSFTQLVHFALLSVHLQCMEEASSKKVLTSNVTAVVTKHKVSVVATVRYETNMGIEAPN